MVGAMFVTFFHELKAAGVPVTLREYLTLMEAMDKALAGQRVEDFYYLSRAALVKDERNLDKFDRVFGHVFKGLATMAEAIEADAIPAEWLRKLAEKYLTEEEKKVTAYHEAGHALVASKLPNSDPLHKVTIIPRGMALGVTMQLPIDDKHNYTKEYLETEIAIMMGGRIAEEMFLNQMSTGAGNDIERATELARKMVCEFGMSDLGPLTFGKKEEQIFLGREIAQHRDYSEATAIKIDDEVRRIVGQGYNTAKGILAQDNGALVRIALALLEREVLDANEIKMIIEGKELP